MEFLQGTVYLAPEGFEKQVIDELEGISHCYNRLFVTDRKPIQSYWAQNIWLEPFIATFESISQAVTLLKGIQRNWIHYPCKENRRATLIQEKLPYINRKPIKFPMTIPEAPLGSFTLLDKNTLLASAKCSSPFPHGEIHFEECHQGPPSRAYLKLWEGLTIAGKMPVKGSRCLEIGSCPGGWTWVLSHLGADVISVDRTELDPTIMNMAGVNFIKGNAFSMKPDTVGPVDWIFSDVACYPEKLLEWITLWIESGFCKNYLCTLKFQGEDNYGIAQKFAEIPGSRVLHLGYNKHELTWIY